MNSTLNKVALFVPSLRGGGAERVTVELANWLSDNGIVVDLIVCEAVGSYLNEVSSQVRLLNIGEQHVRRAIPYLIRYLRTNRPDTILSVQSHANITMIISRFLSLTKTPVVVSERNSTVVLEHGKFRFLKNWLKKLCYRNADRVVAVSEELSFDLIQKLKLHPSRVQTIYNPVNLSNISLKANEKISHPWLNRSDTKIILSVGRLELQKDFALLIDAIKHLKPKLKCKLLILGEGRLRDELQTKISINKLDDTIELVGFKDNPFPWFAAADLFVLSSKHEGMPNALLQAIALGIPVVSTDCKTGPKEILEDGKWGLLSPVGCRDSLAKNIYTALTETSSIDLAQRARDFDHNQVFKRYLCTLSSVIR